MDWVYKQIIGFLANFFAEMGNMGAEMFEMSWVQSIVLFFSYLAWILYGAIDMTAQTTRAKIAIGYRIGHLRVEEATSQHKNGYTIWRCHCDCGGEILLDTRTL